MLCLLISALLALSCYTDALPPEPFIIYSNITNIHALSLSTLARTNLLGGLDRVVPLGVDTVYKHIYFGEHSLGRIYRSNYDGSSKTLIMEDVVNVEGVAIDWIGRKLYWTTYKSETIEVATLDGKYRKVLINAGLEYPRGMAVDPIAGYVFWTDWGAAAAVERCSLDGANRVPLVRDNITWPNGITLDTNQKLVYWIDANHDTINSVDYDGNLRRLIFEDTSLALSMFHGFDLDVIGDAMFFTDWLANAIFEVKISSGVIVRNISVPTTNFIKGAMGLRVVDSSKQQAGTSNCGSNNAGCEQLCFHKLPTGTSCGCQLGMKLTNDQKSCEDAFKDEFIMFADGDAGKIYQMQLDSMNVKPIALPFDEKTNISRPVALEYDRVEDRVYWTDVTLKIVCRAFRNGTGFEVLFDDIGVADGLTIDLAGRLLYWTSTTNNTIETSLLNGSYRRTLFKWYLDEPRDIIVDPIDGYMYWTDWGHFPRIERAYMNGENRMDLVNHTLHWPNGLTIDHIYNKLYWADAYEDNIEVMDLATLERKVVLNQKILLFGYLFGLSTEVNHPYGLTLLRDHLYWTDWQDDAVYRADVNTGANIVLMTANRGKPMDIHAYSAIPKQQQKLYYTFSFPQTGSNFTCIAFTSCPQMDAPPQCPPGYNEVRENSTCGLYCRDIVGYTWRCPCNDWMSCAVKERYLWGCTSGHYSSFRVRECSQEVRPGRCPNNGSQGSQQSCNSDTDCPNNNEKCCNSKCAKLVTIDTHPCRQNNGGCDQLCFGVPGGRKCGCENGFYYNESLSKCVIDTRPITTPPPPPPNKGCKPHPAPEHGSVTCDADPVPQWGECYFKCDPGYELKGYSWDICVNGEWIDDTPTCNISTRPTFSHCPNDTYVPTDPGKSYATVNWTVPTATDKDGVSLKVDIWPVGYDPPVKLDIGWHYVDLTATDKYGEYAYCYFYFIVEDQEPPTFGSSCPDNITLYTENDFSLRLPSSFKKPVATDNAKPPNVYHTGIPHDSFFPIGITMVNYTAVDAAGLSASCIYIVTVVNVCRGVTCTHGSKCVLDTITENSYMCACNSICPQLYDPVCGSDGQTYNNECLMNVSSCSTNRAITVASKGKCSEDEDCITKTCTHGETCTVIAGKAQCSCIFSCVEIYDPVCGSDIKTYNNECKMRATACRTKKNITLHVKGKCDDCTRLSCDYGSTCEVIDGEAKCECDFACADSTTPVCGSDGTTYTHKCALQKEQCAEKRTIIVIKNSTCGCHELNLIAEDFKSTSKIACEINDNSVKCKITCQSGYNAAIPDFLKLQCYNNKWIRQNSDGKYVRLADAEAPPRCYKPTEKNTSRPYCPSGSLLTHTDICVPCPPGSYHDAKTALCVACEVTMYQVESGKTSCKKCSSTKTSTTTGAEDCYFDHGSNAVKMVFEKKRSEVTKDKIRNDIADGLTEVCKRATCTFDDNTASRKRRDADNYKFQATHVIVLNVEDTSNIVDTEVELFVLDPTSTSPLPDTAFSSENLKNLILKIQESDLPYQLKSVDAVNRPQPSTKEETSDAPVIAGVVIAVIVLCIGLVFAIWMYNRRRKNKTTVPPVQFNSAGEGGMQIGQPTPGVSNPQYENPEAIRDGLQHGFVNQVYNDVHAPPPYYESSPVRKPAVYETPPPHVYERPDQEQAGALPAKDKLPDGAVVDVIPPKEVAYEKPVKADSPMKFFHKRGTQPNAYEVPDVPGAQRSATPEDEADMKLEAPPKFNDAKLQVIREKAASSILPNVPRKKKVNPMDANANETTGNEGASHYQNVGNVTDEQSET